MLVAVCPVDCNLTLVAVKSWTAAHQASRSLVFSARWLMFSQTLVAVSARYSRIHWLDPDLSRGRRRDRATQLLPLLPWSPRPHCYLQTALQSPPRAGGLGLTSAEVDQNKSELKYSSNQSRSLAALPLG